MALAACTGDESDDAGESRVDSAARFDGERHKIATTLEAFERAVLADDVGRICGRLLQVRESRDPDNDNGGRRFCVADPANDPARELARTGSATPYDLVVRRIELKSAPARAAERPRRATATVRIGSRVETFLLEKGNGVWEVTARYFAEPGRSHGRYDVGSDCGSADVLVSVFARQPKAQVPRAAVMRGPFGDGIRRALSRGASLSLAQVEYSPDYRHTYLLRRDGGQADLTFPVTVYRHESFDASSAGICNKRDPAAPGHRDTKALFSLLGIEAN